MHGILDCTDLRSNLAPLRFRVFQQNRPLPAIRTSRKESFKCLGSGPVTRSTIVELTQPKANARDEEPVAHLLQYAGPQRTIRMSEGHSRPTKTRLGLWRTGLAIVMSAALSLAAKPAVCA